MPHECVYTGRRTKIGRQCTYRGKAKYLGGVASARAIRSGLVVKRLKRSLTYKHKKAEA